MDRWGRPELEDGLRLYQGIRTIQADNRAAEDRKVEKDAYVAAGLKARGEDISAYPEEVKIKANDINWQSQLNEIKVNTAKMQQSEAGMREKMQKLDLNMRVGMERFNQYKAYRVQGDEKRAKELAMQISNENMYNGRYIEKGDEGYSVTNIDGSKETFKDMPIEDVDRLLGEYFNKTPDEIMQWQMNGEQFRQNHNFNKMAEAEKLYDDDGNLVAVKVRGLWGPDGKPRGVVYMTPDGQSELNPKQVAGLGSIDDAKKRADIAKTKTETRKTNKEVFEGGGGAKPGEIQMPDGSKASRDDLRAEFKMLYNIPDEWDIKLMENSADPIQQRKGKELRLKASEAEFGKFMSRVKKEGRWWENEKTNSGKSGIDNPGSSVNTWLERGRKIRGGNGGN